MPEDFCIGCDTGVYGRQMRIYDADEYTRLFFKVSNFRGLANGGDPSLSVTVDGATSGGDFSDFFIRGTKVDTPPNLNSSLPLQLHFRPSEL